MKVSLKPLLFLFSISLFLGSCGKNYTPEQRKYIEKVEKYRAEKDEYMKNDPGSPFNYKGKVHFKPLKYYDPDPSFVFKSRLYQYEKKDTIKILGTKGEERKIVKFGFVKFNFDKKDYKLNVYKGVSRDGEDYYSIWFTDKTSGKQTYGVGRYLDFDLNPDSSYIYTIDFNLAYNPYCAYSPEYSCAVPSKEDHINLAVEAGEKNFH
ncbi:MAG TPA: DUF1684 domain-containing protein [Ignavibacteriaceae bacterium]|nr:DUF1684 domain-containing protein [Ignavibacteriaceae bacterium]